MRIVCDTNVLVSGTLFGGHSRSILQLVSRGAVTNVISPDILGEVADVLSRRKFGLLPYQVQRILLLFEESFELVVPSRRVAVIEADPADNRILEAAEAASVKFIVSGDKHLLRLSRWKKIQIVSPAQFIAEDIG